MENDRIQQKMYRIVWQMPNGFTGNGEYVLTLELAQAWLEDLTRQYPYIQHWIESDTAVRKQDVAS
jgi:hypothetical protein